ncbi:hypothetical protein ACFQX7_36980 [Luedemannella flava]
MAAPLRRLAAEDEQVLDLAAQRVARWSSSKSWARSSASRQSRSRRSRTRSCSPTST